LNGYPVITVNAVTNNQT